MRVKVAPKNWWLWPARFPLVIDSGYLRVNRWWWHNCLAHSDLLFRLRYWESRAKALEKSTAQARAWAEHFKNETGMYPDEWGEKEGLF